ncbi:hypothetical protein [Paenibacillus mendelii]|uniref:Histidine kinase n=1 Tax=Paenibacillus mendelii TaxID=206163 RepID=A0ABV6JFP7_9BACL|nr:hypothetical protein [Paenibacillus mendelii]MCQ6557407.1 hypothetical protein [Paenibacillus mendelii]
MLAIAGFMVIVAGIIAIDAPPLWRKKQKKELWIFFILLFFGTTLGILHFSIHKIPNPVNWIIIVYKPFSDMIATWLK